MKKYRIVYENKIMEFDTQEKAELYCLSKNLNTINIIEVDESNDNNETGSMFNIINDRIKYYQSVAPQLIRELYVQNTLAGITVEQSDAMFDEYADVLLRLKEGAFPTALFRLSQKQPAGFVTQELLDSWKNKILQYINYE